MAPIGKNPIAGKLASRQTMRASSNLYRPTPQIVRVQITSSEARSLLDQLTGASQSQRRAASPLLQEMRVRAP